MSVMQIPFLFAGRLPFQYGAAMLGSGFEMNIGSVDVAEADANFGTTSPGFGLHVPVWLGLEARPLCNLAVTARGARGFALTSALGPYVGGTVSLTYVGTAGCHDEDYGFQ